jgi:hypothetical protein
LSKQYHIRWRKCQKYLYVTHWQKIYPWHFLTSLSLYIFTIWKCIAYDFFCRDGIYFDKILKETTDTASSASFLALFLELEDSGQLSTKIYDKRDDFNFKIINFPKMCSNIPASPAYGVYISQLIPIWKCIAYNRFCRDGIYFDKILVSEYKLFKRSNKAIF